ncbi:methyltransferase family protein [Mycolicibacterium arseniciresistens]
MAAAAVSLFLGMMLICGLLRTLIQRHRTGDSGNRRTLSPRGSLGWFALTTTDIGYLTVGVGGPLAHWLGLPPLSSLHPPVQLLGVILAVIGILAAFTAQMAMGSSWRIGVDDRERTSLVTTGPFRWVRNPIFTAVLVALLGLTLMVPNVVALTGWVLTVFGIETQVRRVEEPRLHRLHGEPYAQYTATAGRFLPGIGRLQVRDNLSYRSTATTTDASGNGQP